MHFIDLNVLLVVLEFWAKLGRGQGHNQTRPDIVKKMSHLRRLPVEFYLV